MRSQAALGSINARLVLFDSSNRLVGAPGGVAGQGFQGFRDIAYRSDTGNYLLLQDVPGTARAGAPAGACLWQWPNSKPSILFFRSCWPWLLQDVPGAPAGAALLQRI